MVRRTGKLLAAGFAVAALLGGCGLGQSDQPSRQERLEQKQSAPDPQLQKFYDQRVKWAKCDRSVTTDKELECGKVEVPLDYANPAGRTLQLQMARKKADSSRPQGSLFTNPGGPGQSGVESLSGLVNGAIGRPVQKVYDVVSFDPRGVAASAPIRCSTDGQKDQWRSQDPTGDPEKDKQQAKEQSAQFGKQCLDKDADLVRHMDTLSAAKDLDVMRAAVGDKKLNYVGYSYGTLLGSTYLGEFPKQAGRMVLDGVVDPKADMADLSLGQAEHFEKSLAKFADECGDYANCPLKSKNAKGRLKEIDSFLKSLRGNPLRTAQADRPLTQSLAVEGTVAPLYNYESWPTLVDALDRAIRLHDGTQLQYLADFYASRHSDGKYADNSFDAMSVINQLDYPIVGDPQQWDHQAKKLDQVAPIIGATFKYGPYAAQASPIKPAGNPEPTFEGVPKVVLIGNKNDPATPYKFAQSLHKQIPGSSLITLDSWNHCGYTGISKCVSKAVEGYLIEGEQPKTEVSCKLD